MADLREFHGPNAGYVLDLYERYQEDPASLDAQWRSFFESFTPPAAGDGAGTVAPTGAASSLDVEKLVAARELSRAIRVRGHTAARLDPLGADAEPDPALSLEFHGLTEADLEKLPAAVVLGHDPRSPNALAEIRRLREVYSGTIGYDYHHIPNAEERGWLRESIETARFRTPLDAERRRRLLERLSRVEGLERYLHRTFFGQKRFSIEGNDMLVPLLDELLERAGESGARDAVIGMAHRGRLNVLTHVLGKPYAEILKGFLGAKAGAEPPSDFKGDELSGDVKYHMGWRAGNGGESEAIRVTLAPNPSHLEFVNPVVVGMTRAAQDDTQGPGMPTLDFACALAILVHGDAAFPGQGVVAETLNMLGLPGYTVGGTIHVIVNNQVGFTTNPSQARSTRYASDLAKGFEVPIVHVNADDPEACLAAARLAQAYRERFRKDFVIDLIGYRRWGHNEGDEPTFTQPRMYEVIRSHPTAREQFAERLAEAGVISREEAEAMLQSVFDELGQVQESLAGAEAPHRTGEGHSRDGRGGGDADLGTAVDAETLAEFNEALLRWPESFTPNARLAKLLERRRGALHEGGIDWGHAETLAFASLLAEGIPIRLTGQDVGRGTFSHRHQVLHDAESGEPYIPLVHLPAGKASFEIHNSPLSEMGVLGFEYGYSVGDPEGLVLWEAQFGDFANGAQVIIDQFIAAGRSKWEQTSGLVMLLPHGYEGQGPEHSSARLERFLQLAAQKNIRVANCTTAAQYFHLLRRQAALLQREPRPLVVMSPKSLLRHPLAAARLEQLAGGSFQPVLADEPAAERTEVTRLLLCSGKVYTDLMASEAREGATRVAVGRVELLYPFPHAELEELISSFPALQEIVWVQEEPHNMGAWSFVEPRLRHLAQGAFRVCYEGRLDRASPAEGQADRHAAEQTRIVTAAWQGAPEPAKQRAKQRA
ncbi:MAG TPA: 2-oxoglutarate dehydrogenase E1 component [Longimicrobiaceae bacterium]|nr:2-oxoglutarate dehydrogenase E1 component [Longimicrobiaceae bacterium]